MPILRKENGQIQGGGGIVEPAIPNKHIIIGRNREQKSERKRKNILKKKETASEREVRLLIERVQKRDQFEARNTTAELFSRRSSSSTSLTRQSNDLRLSDISDTKRAAASMATIVSPLPVEAELDKRRFLREDEQNRDEEENTSFLSTQNSATSLEVREKALEKRRQSLEQEMALVARQRAAIQLQKIESELRKEIEESLRKEEDAAKSQLAAQIANLRKQLDADEAASAQRRDSLKTKMEEICQEYEKAVEDAAGLRIEFDKKCSSLEKSFHDGTKKRQANANISIRSQLEKQARALGYKLAPKNIYCKQLDNNDPTNTTDHFLTLNNQHLTQSPSRVSVSPQLTDLKADSFLQAEHFTHHQHTIPSVLTRIDDTPQK